jgi:hypothetical protein
MSAGLRLNALPVKSLEVKMDSVPYILCCYETWVCFNFQYMESHDFKLSSTETYCMVHNCIPLFRNGQISLRAVELKAL